MRSFQQRNELKVDGLLKPKGPTGQAVNRVLRRAVAKRRPTPPLTALSGEAFAANGRLVRHLMTTAADGIVPDLMAEDFRFGEAGRAKTADFLSQMFARDPDRAKSLRAKARVLMAMEEQTRLDTLILQARKADADARAQEPGDPDDEEPDEPTPDDPGQDEDPDDDPNPDDPGQDDDPDDDEDDDDDPPKKPDEEKCKGLESQVANAEATVEKQESQIRDTGQELANAKRELAALEAENFRLDIGSAVTGLIGTIIPPLRLPGATSGAAMSGKAAVNDKRIKPLKKLIPELARRLELFKQDLEAFKAKLDDMKEKLAECRDSSG